ncbi:MAG: hypothetical protein JWR32_1553 [Mycobacterium sp.]|jgi:hypothetical protein|nr:hypothetical protein [Mycobacterium sp.]
MKSAAVPQIHIKPAAYTHIGGLLADAASTGDVTDEWWRAAVSVDAWGLIGCSWLRVLRASAISGVLQINGASSPALMSAR